MNPDSLDLVTPEGFGSHIQYSTCILVSSSVTILPSLVFFKKYFSLKVLFIHLAAAGLSCGMQDLV